jgi:hypothetical protein
MGTHGIVVEDVGSIEKPTTQPGIEWPRTTR